ncbi:hypothetical protein H310_06337 [Aphanomyces invadans]|uniref:Uncharacterized protein n=1 Tax=Aphanomyces invadans TaxID=157072 RepID=A0A024U761_9STRA|nr:hypothetical protein H310_06337 [Aphanomyces invadans]ETW01732.1 hypothetical protein H310_06337 [Aphanomyces invadans]|eukprot:XP_008869580.1 hypothetical protein H310_06337 [Aphanomyces invadans]
MNARSSRYISVNSTTTDSVRSSVGNGSEWVRSTQSGFMPRRPRSARTTGLGMPTCSFFNASCSGGYSPTVEMGGVTGFDVVMRKKYVGTQGVSRCVATPQPRNAESKVSASVRLGASQNTCSRNASSG